MTPIYAVLFKCHFWDAFVQRQFERLKQRCKSGDIFVLVDETDGPVTLPIDLAVDQIVRITRAAAEAAGLPHAGRTPIFWYSNDYPLHLFTRRHPHYQYYLMIEFDVVVTADLDFLLSRLLRDQVDFVGEPIRTPLSDWPWLPSCQGWYPQDQILHWLTCLAIFSGRAAHHLFSQRIAAASRLRTSQSAMLPMCEAVIPTEMAGAGFRLMKLHDLGATACYGTSPPRPEESLPGLTDQDFIHPVLDNRRFGMKIANALADPAAFLADDHPLRQQLGAAAIPFVLPYLFHRLYVDRNDRACALAIDQLKQSAGAGLLRLNGLHAGNLALGKPATQSSRSEWSLRPDEANGAVTGPVCSYYKFHTALQQNPWWMVDLLSPTHVETVLVFNRMEFPTRANGLEVYVSADARHWDLAGRHHGDTPFGGADGYPLAIAIDRIVRFVRLELPGQGVLHLDQVHVLGPPA